MSKVAVVIPSGDASRNLSLDQLVVELQGQSLVPDEIEIVRGLSPSGYARNVGVGRTNSPYLVFLDDDVRLGTPKVLETLIETLKDPQIGIAGTPQQLPPESTAFQKYCAEQIPRSVSPVVTEITDSDMATTACCAMRRADLERLGGFHSKILRGIDPELRNRFRHAGFRIVVIPYAWHYHPMPATWKSLWLMAYRNGYSSAFAQKHFPETVLYNPEGHIGRFNPRPSLTIRLGRRLAGLLQAIARGRIGGLIYDLAYACGYFHFRFFGRPRSI